MELKVIQGKVLHPMNFLEIESYSKIFNIHLFKSILDAFRSESF